MFSINGTNVSLTRGDSCYIRAEITGYTVRQGDTLTLSIKEDTDPTSPYLVQKVINDASVDTVFAFEPDDTANLEYGTYKFDIQLDTIDGGRYTIINPSNFVITEEVTYNG